MNQRMLGVEPRHWASLLALAEEGSFRAAAERRAHAESAIRHHVAQLERIVGVEIVERSGRAVTLTPSGLVLAAHARAVVGQLEALAADLGGLADRPARLRVGTTDHGAARLLVAALAALREGIEVVVEQAGDACAQQDAVVRGALDAVVGEAPPPAAPFAVRRVLEDPIVLLVPCERRPPASGPIGAQELRAFTLVAEAGWPTVDLLGERVRAAGCEPPAVRWLGPGVDAQSAVRAIEGAAALLPWSAVEDDGGATVALSLGDLVPPRVLTMFWHARRRRLAGLGALAGALGHAAGELLLTGPARAEVEA